MHPQFFMLNVFMDKTPIFFYFIKNMKRMGDDIKTFMLKINSYNGSSCMQEHWMKANFFNHLDCALALPTVSSSYPRILEPHSACFWCPFCRFSLCALHQGPLKPKEKSHTMIKTPLNFWNFHFIFPVKALCSIIFSFVFNDQNVFPHLWQAMLVKTITSEHGKVQGNTYTCIMLLSIHVHVYIMSIYKKTVWWICNIYVPGTVW